MRVVAVRLAASDFVRKVGQTLGARMVTLAAGATTTVLVARMLGPAGRGEYSVAAAIGAIGVSFGNLGLQSSNTYFVARDRSRLPALLGNTIAATFAAVPLLTAAAGAAFVLSGHAPLHGLLFVLALLGIPLGVAYLLLQNLLLGLRDIRHYNVIEVCTRLLAVALLAALAAAGGIGVSAVFATGLAASAVAATWALRRLLRLLDGRRPSLSPQLLFETMRYGVRAYLAAFFAFLLLRSDIFIVRYELGDAQAGIYSVAVSLADLLYVLPTVIGTILFPRLSEMGDVRRQWSATVRVTLVVLGVMGAAALVVWPLSGPVVRLLFGSAFAHAARSFAILAAAMIFYGANNVISNYAASRGFPAFAVWVWTVGLGLNVVLNFALVPRYGISGSAVASLAGYGLVAVAQGAYFVWEAHARQA